MKIRYIDKINLSKEKLKTIRDIQEIYLKNFIAYNENISNLGKKQVIKRCYQASKLFEQIEKDDFSSGWIKKETETLENRFLNNNGFSFFVEYEGVQVAIHGSLRDLGNFDHCLDHKINLHYCEECKTKFNLNEKGDL